MQLANLPVPGGYGVDKNHSLAYGYYLDAHDVGHWRAPYALAVAHQAGLGVTPNCSRAWHYLQIFIKERSSWTDQNEMAMLAVDAGMHPHKQVLLLPICFLQVMSQVAEQTASAALANCWTLKTV